MAYTSEDLERMRRYFNIPSTPEKPPVRQAYEINIELQTIEEFPESDKINLTYLDKDTIFEKLTFKELYSNILNLDQSPDSDFIINLRKKINYFEKKFRHKYFLINNKIIEDSELIKPHITQNRDLEFAVRFTYGVYNHL